MPDISITDNVGKPVDGATIDWTSATSLFNYLRSEVLHLIVVPDYLARKDQPLTQAAPTPISFQAKIGNKFQLGNTEPEIDITPAAQATLRVNTTKDSNLFPDDGFRAPTTVPEHTGYVGLSFTGSLGLGVGGAAGQLTFGIDKNTAITIEYLKAFSLDGEVPTLAQATGKALSTYVIPASLADLNRMGSNDVCTIAGQGSLKIAGSVKVTTPVNPLAAVNLPLGVGAIKVQDGAMAGLSAALTIVGSYQLRVRKFASGAIELSYIREHATSLRTDLTASAGVSVQLGNTELLTRLLGAISTDNVDKTLLAGLTPDEVKTFTGAVKEGIDHSLQASLDLALSASMDDQVAFQYEIQPDHLDAAASAAVSLALEGDLTGLTSLEEGMQADGTIAPGVKLRNSAFSRMRAKGVALKVNLLGIVNLISVASLVSKCEFITEPASGDLTIKETAESDRITAITNPLNRQEALRKAMFDAIVATTAYRASNIVSMPTLGCRHMHFAVNQNTNTQTLQDYLGWFVALNLLTKDEIPGIVAQFRPGGPSTCLLRTELDDAACAALYLNADGSLRSENEYLDIGRQALRALLDPANSEIDQFRYALLDDPTWSKAKAIGASPELRQLIPLRSTDARFALVLQDVIGDVYDITWWATAMTRAGRELQTMRAFLAERDPVSLTGDREFTQHRENLQRVMLDVVKKSKVRFHEPWGMVSMFWAAGSRQSAGTIIAGGSSLQRVQP